ncbi:MAG: GDP-mannose 4,6-dehydratase, partial [Tatlockia sp.]|nr:GDP-mannose 4,6-dehydratase [Tatlockia sp.]
MNKKTVLVTGGCGFIGSHLVEGLVKKGYRVRILDNLLTGKVE